jgi:hypothetical protein
MSWDATWKLPPTGTELMMSDGYAGETYKTFLKGLSAEDMATYSAGLEAKLNEKYPGKADLVADLLGFFTRAKPSQGGRRRSRSARKSRKAKRASRSTRRR